MSKFSDYNLMMMASGDDEDAFDIIDWDEEDIEDILAEANDTVEFIELYKAFYDDVKTSKNVYKEDW